MKLKRLALPFFSVICLMGFSGCGAKPDNSKRAEAQSLYRESVVMIRHFSDSLMVASDSARVKELTERLMHDLTALNFKYPTETDFDISEGENDTLINLTQRYVFLKDSILYSLAHPVISRDSLPPDSLQIIN